MSWDSILTCLCGSTALICVAWATERNYRVFRARRLFARFLEANLKDVPTDLRDDVQTWLNDLEE